MVFNKALKFYIRSYVKSMVIHFKGLKKIQNMNLLLNSFFFPFLFHLNNVIESLAQPGGYLSELRGAVV